MLGFGFIIYIILLIVVFLVLMGTVIPGVLIILIAGPTSFLPTMAVIIIIAGILLYTSNAVIIGAFIKAASDCLNGQKSFIRTSFQHSLPKWKSLSGIILIELVILFALLMTAFLPAAPGLLTSISEKNISQIYVETSGLLQGDETIITFLTNMFPHSIQMIALGTAIFFIGILFLQPVLYLLIPSVVLGNMGVGEAFNNSFLTAKNNYFHFLLIILVVFVITWILNSVAAFSGEGIGVLVSIYTYSLYAVTSAKLYHIGINKMAG